MKSIENLYKIGSILALKIFAGTNTAKVEEKRVNQQIYSKMLYKCCAIEYNDDIIKKEAIEMAQISLRIEDDVKKSAEQACADIGMSLSTAINIYLRKLGREKRIPFEVSVDPFYSQENMDRLRKSVAQMEATGGTVHEVDFDD